MICKLLLLYPLNLHQLKIAFPCQPTLLRFTHVVTVLLVIFMMGKLKRILVEQLLIRFYDFAPF
jgi:hypothetical protein